MADQLREDIEEIQNKLLDVENYIYHIQDHSYLKSYIEVEYIENVRPNDQEVWLLSDFAFSTSNTLEVKFQYATNIANSDDRVFHLPEKNYAWWLFGRYSNRFRFCYGTNQYSLDSYNLGNQDTNIHIVKANSSFYFDGISKVTGMNFSFSDNMRFANSVGCRLYYIKYSDSNNNLLHNLIPVVRLSDNQACMYDLVSKTFYMPDIINGFIAGPEVN